MPTPTLSEDAIDDILYLARVNETQDLKALLDELSAQHACSAADVLRSAVDSESGNGVLHYAGANGHVDILTVVESAFTTTKADSDSNDALKTLLNAPNSAGNTPLHWAAMNGHLAYIQALVTRGADVSVVNKAGHDAVFEAEVAGREEVVTWLLEGEAGSRMESDADEGDGKVEEKVEVEDMSGLEKVERGVSEMGMSGSEAKT